MVILNDGLPTLLSTRNTLTSVDVTMATVDLALTLVWSCLPMPEVGDHFPIKIPNNMNIIRIQYFILFHISPRFHDTNADWELFEKKVSVNCSHYPTTLN